MAGLTAPSLDAYLRAKGSPMAGLGGFILRTSSEFGVDPSLLVGISGIESQFGRAGPGPAGRNAWGWMSNEGSLMRFPSWKAGIRHVAQGLSQGYIRQGLTSAQQIAGKYAPASAGNDPARWAQVVDQVRGELGGGQTQAVKPRQQRVAQTVTTASGGAGVVPAARMQPSGGLSLKELNGIARQFGYKSFAQAFGKDDAGTLAAMLKPTLRAVAELPGGIPVVDGTGGKATSGKAAKTVDALVRAANQYLGVKYVWGGKTPSGFDCSGLVQWLYKQQGIDVGGYTIAQWRNGRPVRSQRDLRKGDVVFFNWGRHPETGEEGPQHEGLYIGGGLFVQAPRSGDVVKISRMSDRDDFVGARRYI